MTVAEFFSHGSYLENSMKLCESCAV